MSRFFPSPAACTAAALRREFAALSARKAEIERLLDAADVAAARSAAARFEAEARVLRQALAAHSPELSPPPRGLFVIDGPAVDDHALRLTLPDRLHEAMVWLAGRRRQALVILGERRRRALRLAAGALCLGLVVAVGAGGREVWRARQQSLAREARATFAVDLFDATKPLPPDFKVAGLLGLEREGGRHWRWGLGPRTVVAFVLPLPRTVRLTFRVNNPVPGQALTVTANGAVTVLPLPKAQGWMEGEEACDLTFPGQVGLNSITIDYKAYNQFGVAFAPGDPTGYAAAFTAFAIATEQP
ncbi:hypothetical protein [Desulfovibrio sp. TomC]|uniref:hypothetical protein n=1 Tax=Desulfovibrio sp. TomC TaxID=1562888 RepID=UPI000574B557|nr:hypothetical protein [Desulfovibrio sp. TomC]KHK01877.1 hypothetical protein NY78_2696 [Desulfovibrio sp. TomC]